jgi:hypothetical protein
MVFDKSVAICSSASDERCALWRPIDEGKQVGTERNGRLAAQQRARGAHAPGPAPSSKTVGRQAVGSRSVLHSRGRQQASDPRLVSTAVTALPGRGNDLGLARGRLAQAVGSAAVRERCWAERLRAGLLAVLAFLEHDPARARLLLLEEPRRASSWCTEQLHEALAEVLRAARGEVIVGRELGLSTALLAELVVQALFSVLRGRVRAGDRRLVDLPPGLMSFIIAPYLARGGARIDRAANSDGPLAGRPRSCEPSSHEHADRARRRRPRRATQRGYRESRRAVQPRRDHSSAQAPAPARADRTHDRKPYRWTLTAYGEQVLELLTDSASGERRAA